MPKAVKEIDGKVIGETVDNLSQAACCALLHADVRKNRHRRVNLRQIPKWMTIQANKIPAKIGFTNQRKPAPKIQVATAGNDRPKQLLDDRFHLRRHIGHLIRKASSKPFIEIVRGMVLDVIEHRHADIRLELRDRLGH